MAVRKIRRNVEPDEVETPVAATARRGVHRRARPVGAARPAATAPRSRLTENAGPAREILEQLEELKRVDAVLADAVTERDAIVARVREIYTEAGIDTPVQGHGYMVEKKDIKSRSSSEVDVDALYDHLEARDRLEDFWAVVSVGVAEAKKLLTEAEQSGIIKVTEGKITGTEVVIRGVEAVTRKGSKRA